jgi:hypothetical protein
MGPSWLSDFGSKLAIVSPATPFITPDKVVIYSPKFKSPQSFPIEWCDVMYQEEYHIVKVGVKDIHIDMSLCC